MFIVFEGIEGCGKTTQIKLLGSFFEKIKLDCTFTREPGGTRLGEAIREIFLHSRHTEIVPKTELLLITAARVQHVHQVIKPALAAGGVVVCDRFFDATVAYQGYAGGVPLSLIERCHELFLDALNPDLTLLLDCPVDVGLSRSRLRNSVDGLEVTEGRFEDKERAFHESVRKGYLERAAGDPARFVAVDALQPVEVVHEQICRAMSRRLKAKGYAV